MVHVNGAYLLFLFPYREEVAREMDREMSRVMSRDMPRDMARADMRRDMYPFDRGDRGGGGGGGRGGGRRRDQPRVIHIEQVKHVTSEKKKAVFHMSTVVRSAVCVTNYVYSPWDSK